jgi:hypothetical protein
MRIGSRHPVDVCRAEILPVKYALSFEKGPTNKTEELQTRAIAELGALDSIKRSCFCGLICCAAGGDWKASLQDELPEHRPAAKLIA